MYILSSGGVENVTDIIKNKYGHLPATYGRVDEKGFPIETVLTADIDNSIDQCLDYILLMNYKVIFR